MIDLTENNNIAELLDKLNTEGRELAAEYISYLVMTGRYPAEKAADTKR